MSSKTRDFVQKVAVSRGWILQSDRAFLETLIAGLAQTKENNGYYLCPCREGWGIREKDRDIICPCEYAAADIEEFGHCYCALFQSKDYASSKKAPQSIPERRPDELFPD